MLNRLEARGFRNLEPLTLELGQGGHLILGPNGAGKTSLLESIYLLTTTRSFRTVRLAECIRHGEDGFLLRAEAENHGSDTGRSDLEISLFAGDRQRKVNGNRVSLADYLSVQSVVAWTPTELDVLVGPPQARRRFLDRGLVARRPALLSVISRYRQALQEKRGLLQGSGKDALSSRLTEQVDLLMPWNAILAEAASVLIRQRQDYVKLIEASLLQILEDCQLDLPPIRLIYRPSPADGMDGPETILEIMERSAEREILLRRPVLGPHRDELEIRWDGHPIRGVASAGERKALGLALTAAHGRLLEQLGLEPTYLLDDVDTELDALRLASLWRHFGGAKQLLATSNRPAVWADLDIPNRIACEAGRLRGDGRLAAP